MSSEKVTVEKLTNQNYINWSYVQMMLLKKEKLWKYVVSDHPVILTGSAAAASEKAAEEYDEKSDETLTPIALHLSTGQISIIRSANAKEAWDASIRQFPIMLRKS